VVAAVAVAQDLLLVLLELVVLVVDLAVFQDLRDPQELLQQAALVELAVAEQEPLLVLGVLVEILELQARREETTQHMRSIQHMVQEQAVLLELLELLVIRDLVLLEII
jgi:hypothetical protein